MQTFTVNQLGRLKRNVKAMHAVKSPVYCTVPALVSN